MDDPQDLVAFLERIDDDPERHDIVNLVWREVLLLHFLVNAVKVFLPPLDGGLDAGFLQLRGKKLDHLPDEFLPCIRLSASSDLILS